MQHKVLVTGHRGYIGAVLVPMLLERGYDVTGLDIDFYRDADLGPQPEAVPTISVDLRDVTESHLTNFDAVIHLAALSNDPLGNLDAQLTYNINHLGSVRLARESKKAGVKRFLFSSSCSSYGAAGDELLTEEASFNPVTPYGESKVYADREISELADDHFSPSFLRNATAYGFSPKLRLDLVVNDFVAAALLEKKIFIKSDGTPWRPLVHVEDICRAFIAIMESPRDAIHNQAFNVGQTSENYRVSELADIVHKALPDCAIEYDPQGGPDKRCYRVSCDKIKSMVPAFQPQWNVAKGVQQLIGAYREHGISSEAVHQQKYIRLAGLERRKSEGVIDSELKLVASAKV